MSLQKPEFTFKQLLRLLRHLRKGGTRKGACGWAGITYYELELRIYLDSRFAEAVEKWESRSLARDERRLHSKVCKDDRQSLLFRLRRVYGQDKDRDKGKTVQKKYEQSRDYAEIEREINSLPLEERRRLTAAYRCPAPCPA